MVEYKGMIKPVQAILNDLTAKDIHHEISNQLKANDYDLKRTVRSAVLNRIERLYNHGDNTTLILVKL